MQPNRLLLLRTAGWPVAAILALGAPGSTQAVSQVLSAKGAGPGNPLSMPSAVSVDGSCSVLVAGEGSDNAMRLANGGFAELLIDATGDGLGNTLDGAAGVAADSLGNVYVTSQFNSNVFQIAPGGGVTKILGRIATGGKVLDYPVGIAASQDPAPDNFVYVAGVYSNNVFKVYVDAGVAMEIIDSNGDGMGNRLAAPEALTLDDSGNVYVAGISTDNAFRISPLGAIEEIIDSTGDGMGNTLNSPRGIAVDGAGNVFVSGELTNNVFKITPAGVVTQIIDGTGDGLGHPLTLPRGLAVDDAGDVFVAGQVSQNVFRIEPSGTITQIIDATGDGRGRTLANPRSVAVGRAGVVYVTGTDNAFRITLSNRTVYVDAAALPGGTGSQASPLRSIQAGINCAADGDTVVVGPGLYGEVLQAANRSFTLTTTQGALQTIVDAGQGGSVLSLRGDGTHAVRLQGLTLRNGFGPRGGGVSALNVALTVEDCVVSGNRTWYGTAQPAPAGPGDGGGVYSNLPLVLTRTVVANNATGGGFSSPDTASPGGNGGGVYCPSATILDCRMTGNRTGDGGPVTGSNGTLLGSPGGYGGAVYLSDTTGQSVVRGSVFLDNRAGDGGEHFFGTGGSGGWGGAIWSGAWLSVENSIFARNRSGYGGMGGNNAGSGGNGGACRAREMVAVASTFVSNQLGAAPYLGVDGMGSVFSGGEVTTTGCILWNNQVPLFHGVQYSYVSFSDVEGGWGGVGNIDADPLFVDAGASNFRLAEGSPAIDAGDSSAIPVWLTKDVYGAARFRDDKQTANTGSGPGIVVDMGAAEFQPRVKKGPGSPAPTGGL